MSETVRYIPGYILGFTVFIILIPFGLYSLYRYDCLFSGRIIFSSDILRYLISVLVFLTGAYFAIWSNIFLFRIGKGGPVDAFGVSITPRTRNLVTTGPYRCSRNQMVLGAFLVYSSIVLYLNSITGVICLIILLIIMIIFLKMSEEKRLLKDFGDEYIDYKKKVSILLPIKMIRR